MLSKIKEYLKEQGQASLRDIAVHFDVSEEAAQGMLEHWERKGKVRRMESASCGGACGHKCSSCPMQCSMIYQWTDPEAVPLNASGESAEAR